MADHHEQRRKIVYQPKRFCCPLVGLKNYNAKKPVEGDTVLLVPEQFNEFDKYAVAVYNKELEQIGYVRQRDNTSKFVHDRLQGKPAFAKINYADSRESSTPIILIDIEFLSR